MNYRNFFTANRKNTFKILTSTRVSFAGLKKCYSSFRPALNLIDGACPQLEIKFCNRAKKLVFRNDNEQIIAKIPIKGLSIQQIMGSNKSLKSMLYKINNRRDFSL